MPSIIPGYEYDIFISYRQKDNQSDQWVTKFIESLPELSLHPTPHRFPLWWHLYL